MSTTQRVNILTPTVDEQNDLPVTWNHLTDSDGFSWYINYNNFMSKARSDNYCICRVGFVDGGGEYKDVKGFVVELFQITDNGTLLVAQEAITTVEIPYEVGEAKTKAIMYGLMRKVDDIINSYES